MAYNRPPYQQPQGFYPQPQGFYQPRQYAPQPQAQPQQQYKKSGATYSKIKKGNFQGETIVNAWRKTKYGLMTATVSPYSGSKGKGDELVESQKGNQYKKMICTITNTSLGTSQTYHVLMNLETQVIVISELSLCITPNGSGYTRSGKKVTGYFGANYKRK